MTRREIASQAGAAVSVDLAGCERANAMSLVSTLRMSAAVVEARMKLGANICVQSDLIRAAGALVVADFERHEQLLQLHTKLSDVSLRLGIDPRAVGDGGMKDDDVVFGEPTGVGRAGLRSVG